jgi:ketosteroid isomerase-like protein
MVPSQNEILELMTQWETHWNRHDLDGVMALFHDQVLFEHWNGAKIQGKEALRRAWEPWFADPGGFRFVTEDLFADESTQKVLYRWTLEWPSLEKGYAGKPEKRRGVDVITFQDGKIIQKLTYSKTVVEIEGQRVRLEPPAIGTS